MHIHQFLEHYKSCVSPEGQHLVFDYFIVFSRFECALKAAGFCKSNSKNAEPDWNKFIKKIKPIFKSKFTTFSEGLRESVNYLITNPPMNQIVSDGKLSWTERQLDENMPDIDRLKCTVLGVRNNLFHGGKFNGTYNPELSRNFKLLNHSIVLLDYWLSLDTKVAQAFSEQFD